MRRVARSFRGRLCRAGWGGPCGPAVSEGITVNPSCPCTARAFLSPGSIFASFDKDPLPLFGRVAIDWILDWAPWAEPASVDDNGNESQWYRLEVKGEIVGFYNRKMGTPIGLAFLPYQHCPLLAEQAVFGVGPVNIQLPYRQKLRSKDGNGKCSCRDSDIELPVSSESNMSLLELGDESGTIRVCLESNLLSSHGKHIPPSGPEHLDQPHLASKSILTPKTQTSSDTGPNFHYFGRPIVGLSQSPLDQANPNQEYSGQKHGSLRHPEIPELPAQVPSKHTSPHSLPIPPKITENSKSFQISEYPAKGSPTMYEDERCICGYSPSGLERNKACNLRRHQKTCSYYSSQGSNNKSFACSYPGREKAYNRSDALVVHQRSKKHNVPFDDVKGSSDSPRQHSSERETLNAVPSLSSHHRSSEHQALRGATFSSSQNFGLQCQGAKRERTKWRAPRLERPEEEVIQRAVPKRRRLVDDKPIGPYS
ncbi:hypothetical protein G7Y89_g4809 [Cudoniella acicularis]|uniref:Uncharacterized protein n=1 Tax=Cudoniella acicularis TaxID=354080 RepID=A0A8H4W3Y3_9HELO|nr:hypothetical protein G7Y89_g4809 [Cudoniella acicularis]